MKQKKILIIVFNLWSAILFSTFTANLNGQEISKSFELRYFTTNPQANGETDFKGETQVFDTEQRVEFLKHYAQVAKDFFNDPHLNTEVVSDKEANAFVSHLKSQPLPAIRKHIPLKEWKWMGYKEEQHDKTVQSLQKWNNTDGVCIDDGALLVTKEHSQIKWNFPSQSWRCSFRWRIKLPATNQRVSFAFSDKNKIPAATVGFTENGAIFYRTAEDQEIETKPFQPDKWYTFKVEFDFQAPKRLDFVRYNLYVNGQLLADHVPMQRVVTKGVGYASSFSSIGQVNTLIATCSKGMIVDDLWGVGYSLTGRENFPYTTETFLDENFEIKPVINNWQHITYNDSSWNNSVLPIVHGSERNTEEDLYLRKIIELNDFHHAFLNIETLDPGGEVWINGKIAAVISNRHPNRIDVTSYLKKHDKNIIGVKVNNFYLTKDVGEMMPHTSLDFNIGWFAGRMSLDLTDETILEEVFIYTDSLSESARLKVRLKINHLGAVAFHGSAIIKLSPWFPEENPALVSKVEIPVVIGHGVEEFQTDIIVNKPNLWTCEYPNLYKAHIILKNESGEPIDDYVLTTGIRTLSQEGGTFRLNGEPAMLNGALIMGSRAPIENLVKWHRCAPAEWIAKELLMVKKMNGNLLRVLVHGWEFPARGINDPRYAEMADQLGIMLLWTSPAWIRTGWGWGQIDFEGYPKYMRQVYNHPSIVMWEAANHTQSFKDNDVSESNLFCDKVYQTIYPVDPSRLISFNSYILHLHYGNDEGTIDQNGKSITPSPSWTAPMVTRGNHDYPTGYGKRWSEIRNYPGEYRQSFLDSKERAYFNFEHEESIAQPNWTLVKGKPWYRLHSYEWDYDKGSIGRRLTLDEWQESQAWQAFSAWEAIKKMRWLDYDGFTWCCLYGGDNCVTYKKPLIDFLGHAKLAFWVNKMAFQRTIAGSNNVDVAYGPDDPIQPIIMHWGNERVVQLNVRIYDQENRVVDEKVYPDVHLESGRFVKNLKPFKRKFDQEGYLKVEYLIE